MKTLTRLIGFGALALLAVGACDKNGDAGNGTDMAVPGGNDLSTGGGEDLSTGGGNDDLSVPADMNTGGLSLLQIAPSAVSTAGGTALTLTGTGFLTGATVTIAGVAAGSPMVNSATEITANAPAKAGACGPVAVEIANQSGPKATASNLLSYFIPTANLGTTSFAEQTLTGGALSNDPYGTAVLDFNKDGKNDFVVAVQGTNPKLALFQNDGTGAFGTPTLLDIGQTPRNVTAGNLDGDGQPDVIVANLGAGTAAGSVSVFLSKAGGGFNAATTVTLTDTKVVKPRAATLADMNNDTKLDLLVADESNGKVYIAFGNGNGTFDTANAKGFALAGTTPQGYALAVGLFDNDTMLDVAVVDGVSNRSVISVLLNDGTGGLKTATSFTVGTNPRGVVSGDFDGDGKADLAVTNLTSNTITILKGNGAGSFSTAISPGTGNGPRGVALADMNCDGKPDLVVALSDANAAGVMLNQSTGAGNFAFKTQSFSAGTSSAPELLSVGDTDGDGRPDIIVGKTGSKAVGLLKSALQ